MWEGEKNIRIRTHMERKSGILFADKLERATAQIAKKNCPEEKNTQSPMITDSPFFEYESAEKETGLEICFAYPYRSGERGSDRMPGGRNQRQP